jgi:ribose transport system substrate-binding protein
MSRRSSPPLPKNDDVEVVVLDAGGDVARQIAQMEDLIQQDVDAMIIWPTNGEAVIPAVREAYQAGSPSSSPTPTSPRTGFRLRHFVLRSRQHHARRALGRDHVRPVHRTGHRGRGPRGQITGQPGYTTAIERAKGFQERLPEVCPNVTLVDSQPGNWNREDSQQVMEAFLVKYDDIDGVYSGDDNMGVGALNAANAAGRRRHHLRRRHQLRRGLRRDGAWRVLGVDLPVAGR